MGKIIGNIALGTVGSDQHTGKKHWEFCWALFRGFCLGSHPTTNLGKKSGKKLGQKLGQKLGNKSREMLTKLTGNSGEHLRVLSLFIGKKKVGQVSTTLGRTLGRMSPRKKPNNMPLRIQNTPTQPKKISSHRTPNGKPPASPIAPPPPPAPPQHHLLPNPPNLALHTILPFFVKALEKQNCHPISTPR